MAERLQGQVAVVTGAASGIGRAIAQRFAAEGAAVCVADLDAARGQQAADAITQAGGRALAVEMDVRRGDDHARAIAETTRQFGRLTVYVNNAGIGRGAPVAQLSEEDWDAVLDVNLKGVFLGCKHAFPALMRGGGLILNLASVAGVLAPPGFAAYGAAKAGVIHLTKIVAMEGAGFKIRCNALSPTWIDTPLLESYVARTPSPEAARRELAASIPLGRIGTPDDVAAAAVYLASEEAVFLTGVALPVDGGMTAGHGAPRR